MLPQAATIAAVHFGEGVIAHSALTEGVRTETVKVFREGKDNLKTTGTADPVGSAVLGFCCPLWGKWRKAPEKLSFFAAEQTGKQVFEERRDLGKKALRFFFFGFRFTQFGAASIANTIVVFIFTRNRIAIFFTAYTFKCMRIIPDTGRLGVREIMAECC